MADEAKDAKEQKNTTTKELEFEGYKFTVDTDLLDDVESFENIDRIENKGQVTAIVPLLLLLIGEDGYNQMKEYFSKKDAEEHKDQEGYKGRFRLTKLTKIYEVIIENFDPKG